MTVYQAHRQGSLHKRGDGERLDAVVPTTSESASFELVDNEWHSVESGVNYSKLRGSRIRSLTLASQLQEVTYQEGTVALDSVGQVE